MKWWIDHRRRLGHRSRMHPLLRKHAAKWTQKGECFIWTGYSDRKGYPIVELRGDGARRAARLQRLIKEVEIGTFAEKNNLPQRRVMIRHTCDCPSCVNPAHLLVGTAADNSKDMTERDRSAKGEEHSQAVLTEGQVKQIREKRAQGASYAALGREYGVHWGTARAAALRLTWRHV